MAGTTGVAISNEALAVTAIISVLLVVVAGAWGGGIGVFILLLTSAIWAPLVVIIAFLIIVGLKAFARLVDRPAKPPLDPERQGPMTPIQEDWIARYWANRQLPPTKYGNSAEGLAAFKNSYGRPITEQEADGLISWLQELPIKQGQTGIRASSEVPVGRYDRGDDSGLPGIGLTIGVIILLVAMTIAGIFWASHKPAVSTQSSKAATPSNKPIEMSNLERAKMILEKAPGLRCTPDELRTAKDYLVRIYKQDADYPEAQRMLARLPNDAVLATMIKKADAKIIAAYRNGRSEQEKSRDKLWKEYAWCRGWSSTPWKEHPERSRAYMEFLMKDRWLDSHPNLKGWTSKWRP